MESDTVVTNSAVTDLKNIVIDKLEQLQSVYASQGWSGGELDNIMVVSKVFLDGSNDEFLLTEDIAKIARCISELYTLYGRVVSSVEDVAVTTVSGESNGHLYFSLACVLVDRPFIVVSLAEYLKSKNLEIRTLIHPTLLPSSAPYRGELHQRVGGQAGLPGDSNARVSLSYFEMSGDIAEADAADMVAEVKCILRDLIATSNAYEAIVERMRALENSLRSQQNDVPVRNGDIQEIASLTGWMADLGFVFLGYQCVVLGSRGGTTSDCFGSDCSELNYSGPNYSGSNCCYTTETPATESSGTSPIELRGLLLSASSQLSGLREYVDRCVRQAALSEELFRFYKLPCLSTVYRRQSLNLLVFRETCADGRECLHCVIGMFSTRVLQQDVRNLPMFRQIFDHIVEKRGVLLHSFNYKEITYILNSMPKAEMLWLPLSSLENKVSLILKMQRQRRTRVILSTNSESEYLVAMVVMPHDRYSESVRYDIQRYLEEQLGVNTSECKLAVSEDHHARLHFLLYAPVAEHLKQVLEQQSAIESEIANLTFTWKDKIEMALATRVGMKQALLLAQHFSKALTRGYQSNTPIDQAATDIIAIEDLSCAEPSSVSLSYVEGTVDAEVGKFYELKIFTLGSSLSLSQMVPILENCGFVILDEVTTSVSTTGGDRAAIYRLRMLADGGLEFIDNKASDTFIPGIKEILKGNVDNDRLNSLLILGHLSIRQVMLLRTLRQYLLQIKYTDSGMTINRALVFNPGVTRILVQYFEAKFNPLLDDETRSSELEKLEEYFFAALKSVKRLIEDQALRAAFNVLVSTVRTNYYLETCPSWLAIKVSSMSIAKMPDPRPLFEVFIHSHDFEGIHLRASRVARGGLRWSERPEDFRTEVLGLMKTQVVKNSIIIPNGAKGGFVLRGAMADDPCFDNVKACYTQFVTALLELADNISPEGVIVPPLGVVRFDEDDPYLVVAADKGTATFSDLANSLATGRGFWLGDAFASGGSNGYDHKKMGITAKGAWESVICHFKEVGIDVDHEVITAVGIGDMAGDVFGNGLLCSQKIRLIGAFNHRHIFIDPSPDPELSFMERLRLFRLPKSAWTDYRKEVLSSGGGVYDRSAKEIALSPEAQLALGLAESSLSGEALVRAILKAPVDLFWNGGIGTYVKSAAEDNLAVGDRANDDVRVDASELRARVVAEGGNLGFTQRARIEFAQAGGHINTDAIDNSGGVDLSDFEVNLKILLDVAVKRGTLTVKERNELLSHFSEEAVGKILSRNRGQNLALSIECVRSQATPEYFADVIRGFTERRVLHYKNDSLPTKEELLARQEPRRGLLRPELALLLAHSKLLICEEISKSVDIDESTFHDLLGSYFPTGVQERFAQEMLLHPLRKEIVACRAGNLIVELMGATFIPRVVEDEQSNVCDVVQSFLVAFQVLQGKRVLSEIEGLDVVGHRDDSLRAYLGFSEALDVATRWVLQRKKVGLSYADFAALLAPNVQKLTGRIKQVFGDTKTCRSTRCPLLHGDSLVNTPALVWDVFEIADLSLKLGLDVVGLGKLYVEILGYLDLSCVLQSAESVSLADEWERRALKKLLREFKASVAELVETTGMRAGDGEDIDVETLLSAGQREFSEYKSLLNSFADKSVPNGAFSIGALYLLLEQLRVLGSVYRA